MARSQHNPPGAPQGQNQDPPGSGQASKSLERRLTDIEISVDELWASQFGFLKWWVGTLLTLVGIIFGVTAGLLIYFQITAKNDVKDAVNQMKSDFKDQATEFEKKFATLSGDALKKPLLRIYTGKDLLDGRELEISKNNEILLEPFVVKNEGDKRAEPSSVRLYCSGPLEIQPGGTWQRYTSDDKDYPWAYAYTPRALGGIAISPGEPWTFNDINEGNFMQMATNIVSCRLLVFYGAEKPAEAKFRIKLK